METIVIVLLLCLVAAVGGLLSLGYRLMRLRLERETGGEQGREQWRRQMEAEVVRREEARFALARAGRGGDREAVESAVAGAYGWPADKDDGALVARLTELNLQRAG